MSIAPDAKELNQMRQDAKALMSDFCNLLTVTRTSDSQGGFSEAWGTVTKNVPCRLDQLVGSERQTDGSLRAFTSYELTLPWDTTITEAYRVEHAGNTYLVTDANGDQTWPIERAVLVERMS